MYTEVIQWLCYILEMHFTQKRDQYKVVLSDHLHPTVKYFYSNGSSLFQDDYATMIHR